MHAQMWDTYANLTESTQNISREQKNHQNTMNGNLI